MTVQLNDLSDDLTLVSAPMGYVSVPRRPGVYRNAMKRLIDVLVVCASSVVVVPAIAVMAFLVSREGHSPFYFGQRVGRNGRIFWMVKLRTMVPNAERFLEAYLAENPEARAEWEATQKLKCDPRITRFGRFLRRTSLDELLQLWNVLKGDMSLVGPRPMMPEQRILYHGTAYYALRPGITGSWQVSVRNDSEFSERARFDREYDFRLSLIEDIRLLAKTFLVVVRATGY